MTDLSLSEGMREADAERECRVCGGDVERVSVESHDGELTRHYRCQGECREGGMIVGLTNMRRYGPVVCGRTPELKEAFKSGALP